MRRTADSVVYTPSQRDSIQRDSLARRATRVQALGIVRVTAAQGSGLSLARPATALEGRAFDRRLAPSIAATIAGEPGVTARSNGPMATQPVIRGLTGDRVLVLEDGQRTGDIATTAPDHAVTIDPMTARRVEVIRGPAGLLFGSNSLGGVVNVVRDDVPTERITRRIGGTFSGQGESVNDGGVAHGALRGGVGPLAWRVSGSWRTAGDTRAPAGVLPYSDVRGHDVGMGAALVDLATSRGSWRLGAAARDVVNAYGVPGSFAGIVLPGAHDGGVYVDLARRSGRVDASWRSNAALTGQRWWPQLSQANVSTQFTRFEQSELERGGFVGTRFGQLMANGDALVHYVRKAGVPIRGSAGAWMQWRDFRAEGSFTGTRPGVLRGAAVFAMEEMELDAFFGGRAVRLQWGARWDAARIVPLDSTETALVRDVRTRAFTAPTGSVGLTAEVHRGVVIGTSVARAFRPPAIEELFSAGPHLATYAYEVGNPQLRAEQGLGLDLFTRITRGAVRGEFAIFSMRVGNFIYQRPLVDSVTGAPVRDQRLRRYNVYQADQADARLHGAEGRLEWSPWARRGVTFDATASWVQGTQRNVVSASAASAESWVPLPAMPPLRTRLQSRWEGRQWSATGAVEAAARQGRVPPPPRSLGANTCVLAASQAVRGGNAPALLPAEFCPTDGWAVVNVSVARRWLLGTQLHEVTASVDNLFDVDWRDHLWRAKQVAPQPGRNVRLLYRWSW
ncbi:TonB-dependent receptor [Gemmatimonas sp.]|uniref:TonB-dependent receptor n=1 Tax=Gemmatimonas sp. TaxID=1962908 RepID=UPI0037C19DAB